ncbi:NnrU family protein [Halomonas llamarensis]|uniref:NnrU family protein n=1 Tax=Halomonas llamarensis TaxID=2945104 RepID=A0ABT0SRX5_9GAMM|nr:NnrU family protein [Halomonas llamarensis]MCL7930542.1 NnrU family protein [Halomonas llamarensis]
MTVMILGLVIFLGLHSVRIVAADWRHTLIQRLGLMPWKAIYSVIAIIGLGLAIWGYGQMRLSPVWVWSPPSGLAHLVALLMIPAFILLVAAYVPGNHIKARLGHPMILAVKLWAFSHLLINGRLGDIVFFGAFLVWAIFDFRDARRRPQQTPQAPRMTSTLAAVVIGLVAYYLFAFHLHVWVTGVPVM